MSDRLLVIDDEPDFANFVARVAESCAYEVRTTDNPTEFRALCTQWRPSHIILDLVMPEADGVELLRYLAGVLCSARIWIMSGFDGRVVDAARRIGTERGLDIVGTLQKPMRAKELRAVLEQHHTEETVVTVEALEEALGRGEILPFYQPKVVLNSLQPVGFEALARWQHSSQGTICPDRFIPVAEASGQIDALSETVTRQAVSQMGEWKGMGIEARVAINLSAHNLHEEALADRLNALCRHVGVPEESITIEITETAAMAEPLRALDILTRLRIKGFKLSIDDFGTGFSSLVQLHRLPFSELKIDQSFVKECDSSREARIIVKTMIELAHNLDMSVVAEGVETEAVLQTLADLGCDVGQGYALARPMGAGSVPAWLAQWAARHPHGEFGGR
ncbi:MAG: EAL domain-containing response regulator [Rhodospirillaceae bacterium]|nr:EAL domain-containing response regulator [Rhodospirillales bacterium]